MPHFNYLKNFLTIYRNGSLNKASDILGKSQPALSRQLSTLERMLGKKLHKKGSGNKLVFTDDGHLLAQQLAPHIDQIEHIYNEMRESKTSLTGVATIGGISEFIEIYLSPVIAELVAEHIHFNLKHCNSKNCIEQLERQQLDFGLVSSPPQSEAIGHKELVADRLVTVVSSGLFRKEPMTEENILPWNYIEHSLSNQCSHYKQYFAAIPCEPDIFSRAVKVGSYHTVLQLVRGSAGFSIIPYRFVRHDIESGILKEIEWKGDLPRMRLYLAWNMTAIRMPRNKLIKEKSLSQNL